MTIDTSRRGSIAFQGEFGANSDTACRHVYPNMDSVPCPTFEDVFELLKSGKVDLAMIPIENTLAGRVADIHRLLPRSGLHIIGELFLPIHFHLMALPGVKKSDIRHVYSHIHALGQCRDYLRENGWQGEISADTAGSARLISERGDKDSAALAPPLAAELYGLEILEENVEDADRNTTRFVVLSRDSEIPPITDALTITTFIFRVRNVPAALYKVLGGFATNGINMTKLESYQEGGAFSATLFYADIEGHIDSAGVKLAMEDLGFFCSESKILGVYPASLDRP